jgi:putative ABC transport system permease protein
MLGLVAPFRQAFAVMEFSIVTALARWSVVLVAILGIVSVSLVLVSVLAVGSGFRRAYQSGGAADVLIVMKASATSELGSNMTPTDVGALREAVSAAFGGAASLSEESYYVTQLRLKSRDTEVNVPVRGAGVEGRKLRRGFRVVAGRLNQPGLREVLAGDRAHRDYAGLDVGDSIRLGKDAWRIVGVFTSENEVANSEVWGDPDMLRLAYSRDASSQAVYIRLPAAAARFDLESSIAGDKRLQLQSKTEAEYYRTLAQSEAAVIKFIGYVAAIGMSGVSVFVLIGSMYSSVSARARQIAIFRAVGFSAASIFIGILCETVLIALAGGLIGGGLSYLLFNGVPLSTINLAGGFTQVPFTIRVDLRSVVAGAGLSGLLGLLAGMLPALSASRSKVMRLFG